jgi:acyl-CoA synthetase (AMP-forming)/AMP-acid ligase II
VSDRQDPVSLSSCARTPARSSLCTWAQFDWRADGVARTLLDGQAGPGGRVAQYLRNSPEYLEVSHAALKIGIPAANSNYRYKGEELRCNTCTMHAMLTA